DRKLALAEERRLDRHMAMEISIIGEIDGTHRTPTKQTDDLITSERRAGLKKRRVFAGRRLGLSLGIRLRIPRSRSRRQLVEGLSHCDRRWGLVTLVSERSGYLIGIRDLLQLPQGLDRAFNFVGDLRVVRLDCASKRIRRGGLLFARHRAVPRLFGD